MTHPLPIPAVADPAYLAALQAVMEATGDGTWYFEFEAGEVRYNAAWYRMLGYEPAEVGHKVEDWLSLIHPEDLPAVNLEMEAHLAGKTDQFRSEHRLRTKSGEWLWILDRGRILARDEEGRPLVAAGVHMDISAQKAAERSLRASEARFRALAELAPVGIFLADATGCTFANEAWSRITGWPLDEALGLRWAQAIHPEDRDLARGQWEAAARTGRGFEMESRYLTPGGDVRWGFVQVSPFPGIGPRGEGGFIGVVTDTTERHASDELLKRRLKELGDLKFALDQSAIVALTDAQGVILEANEKFTEISGFSHEELVGRTHRVVKSGHHSRAYFGDLWDTIKQGKVWHGEIQNRAKDGRPYWVDTTITPFLGEDGTPDHYLAIRFDISERHRAEDELSLANAFLLQAMESIPGAFAIFDADDRLQRCNNRYMALLPESFQSKALGLTFETLAREILRRQMGMEGDALEERLKRRVENHRAPGASTQYRGLNGRVIRVVERETEEGGRVVLGLDISEDIAREEELTRARQAAESANAAKDRLVAFVSHELRAPLQAILGFAELLFLGADENLSPPQRRHIQGILECGERQARLLNDLLDLASLEAGRMAFQRGPVHVRPLLEGALSAVDLEASKAGITCRLEGEDLWVMADAGRLDQVLLNLLSNAVKYNRPGGRVAVRSVLTAGGQVRIEVEDTGQGIPEHRQAEVYEAYNRLGREGSPVAGTGLGLSLTRKLVEGMGGRMGFTSALGVGSTFWVELEASV